MSFEFKTLAEQRLEYLCALKRPLTDEESDLLRRSMHAVYSRNRRKTLVAHRREELATMEAAITEAAQPELMGDERR